MPWVLPGSVVCRVANECRIPVTINDRDPQVIELIAHNICQANLPVEIVQRDANALLSERSFDVVDLDPFGTPAMIVDAAVQGNTAISFRYCNRYRTLMRSSPEGWQTPLLCAADEYRISWRGGVEDPARICRS